MTVSTRALAFCQPQGHLLFPTPLLTQRSLCYSCAFAATTWSAPATAPRSAPLASRSPSAPSHTVSQADPAAMWLFEFGSRPRDNTWHSGGLHAHCLLNLASLHALTDSSPSNAPCRLVCCGPQQRGDPQPGAAQADQDVQPHPALPSAQALVSGADNLEAHAAAISKPPPLPPLLLEPPASLAQCRLPVYLQRTVAGGALLVHMTAAAFSC